MPRFFWWSLLLRLVLVSFALITHRWMGGDSSYFLDSAQLVCSGQWGGDQYKQPLYSQLICLLSPHARVGMSSAEAALPLLLQAFAIAMSGVLIWKTSARVALKERRKILAAWCFDPVLMIYSTIFMSDASLGLAILLLGVLIDQLFLAWPEKKEKLLQSAAWLGAVMALVVLVRSVGVLVVQWAAVCLGAYLVLWARKRKRWRDATLAAALTAACFAFIVGPRVYWNKTRYGLTKVVIQDSGYLAGVAGAVELAPQGLDFYSAELKWARDPRSREPNATAKTLLRNWPRTLEMTGRSLARVLIGHANVEWAYFFTGKAPIGPGWFKVPEKRKDAAPRVEGTFRTVLWIVGLLTTLLSSTWIYFNVIKTFFKRKRKAIDWFTAWAGGSISLLAVAPVMWGDSRFRLPILPLVLLVWIRLSRERPAPPRAL